MCLFTGITSTSLITHPPSLHLLQFSVPADKGQLLEAGTCVFPGWPRSYLLSENSHSCPIDKPAWQLAVSGDSMGQGQWPFLPLHKGAVILT